MCAMRKGVCLYSAWPCGALQRALERSHVHECALEGVWLGEMRKGAGRYDG